MSKLLRCLISVVSYIFFTVSASAQGIEEDLLLGSEDTIQTFKDTVIFIPDQNEKTQFGKISFGLSMYGGYSLINLNDVIAELDLSPSSRFSGSYFTVVLNTGIEYVPVPVAGFKALIGKTGVFHLGVYGNVGTCSHRTKVIDTIHVVDVTTGWGGITGEKSLIYRETIDWRAGFLTGGGKVWLKSKGGQHFSEKFALLGIHSNISCRYLKWFSTGIETKLECMFSLEDSKTTHYGRWNEPTYKFRSFSPGVVLFVNFMAQR